MSSYDKQNKVIERTTLTNNIYTYKTWQLTGSVDQVAKSESFLYIVSLKLISASSRSKLWSLTRKRFYTSITMNICLVESTDKVLLIGCLESAIVDLLDCRTNQHKPQPTNIWCDWSNCLNCSNDFALFQFRSYLFQYSSELFNFI